MKVFSGVKKYQIEIALFVFGVLLRIPFRSQILYHWDSVNFAFAMRNFDMLHDQPQPPGYILYVWLSRTVNLIFTNENASMVWISVISSGLAVTALYLLGRAMWDWKVGLAAALFLATSPLFWFYGEIALPHTVDAFLVILAAWLLYRIQQGEGHLAWLAAIILGIIGGVRQQSLVFLAPLVVYAFWRAGWRQWLLTVIIGGIVCLTWFIPLMASTGGIVSYLAKTGDFSRLFQQHTSVLMGAGLSGIRYNVGKIIPYTLYGWSVGIIPVIFWLGYRSIRRMISSIEWKQIIFLVIWAIPPLAFYSFIHMGQQGLIFIYLPVLILISARALTGLWSGRILWGVTIALVVVNIGIFTLAPEYPLGGSQRLLTRQTLVNHDRFFLERIDLIRQKYSPDHTVIVAPDWHHLEYYLPGYDLLRFDENAPNQPTALTPRQWPGNANRFKVSDLNLLPDDNGKLSILFFDPIQRSYQDIKPERIILPGGDTMELVFATPQDVISFEQGVFEVIGVR